MHRLLIPLFACFFLCTPSLLRAQVPHEIQHLPYDLKKVLSSPQNPDMMCGDAGTYTFGQFNGSSNDGAPPPIFLCFGDSLLVQHNGDADLSGDPNAATTPGIAFAFYDCPPTIMGDNLQMIGEIPGPGDPCVLSGSTNGLYITQAVQNGGATWFFNSGALQNTFNMGQPYSLYFAPITVDDFAGNNYESAQVGFPPGPCVNVNTAAAFEVVYLNEITATGINNNFGNDCLGRFTIRGGYPQYDPNALYTISIVLASNPSVKAIIHTAATQLFHLSSVAFSVPQSGLYTVTVEDGKSCPATFQIDMNVCNASDNLTLTFPDTIVTPGGSLCVPITVQNFNILSGSFSIEWNELVLQYSGLQNINPAIAMFFGPANLNEIETSNGFLGVQIFNNLTAANITIPDDEVLFNICFNAIGNLGDCSGIGIVNTPTGVALEDEMGQNLALTVDTGQICISFLPLGFSVSVVDTTCLGQADLVITPFGGVEPYDIIVDELPSGPTFSMTVFSGEIFTVMDAGSTNNTPVTYQICVIDNNGTGATRCTTIVVDIPRLGAQLNFAQQPLCNGGSTGIINAVVLQGGVVVPSPGTNYTYAWAPANMTVQGSQVQNGVKAGLYTVTVTDTNTGCSEVASGSLGQPAQISSQSVVFSPAACSGICDGIITYEAEGGTPFAGPAYQYTWIYEDTNTPLGPGLDNPIVLANACSGEYRVVITDANGCVFIDSNLVLNNLRTLGITQNSLTNVSCNGGNNGAIGVTVTESVATGSNFTFTWTPGGFTQGGTSPNSTYTGLPVGTYSVSASDNLGCQIADTFMITQPSVLSLVTLAVVNPICAQPNSGSVCVQALGGTGSLNNYQYAWSNAGVSNCQSGLPFGIYTVTVTDLNLCTATLQFNLPQPAPPTGSVAITAVKCGADGALTANYPSSIGIFWTDINGVLIDSTATIDSLMGGDYIVTAFDGGGCVAIDTITLNGVIPMSFSDTTLMQPTCFGFNDGRIAIGVQNGQPAYSFNWSTGQANSPLILNLIAGTYTVTVTDIAQCTLIGTFVLDQPPAIVNTFDPSANGRVTCFGAFPCDGEATPITTYTNGPGDFTFLWNDGVTDSLRVNLCAGLNTVIIRDAAGCFITDTIVITTPPQITAASQTTPNRCFGDNTGAASITATGGNGGPYTFLWNTGAVTPGITNVIAGNYSVTITDVLGCSNSINTIVIAQPAAMGTSTKAEQPFCFGGDNGQISVDVSGGVAPYFYNWEDASGNNIGTTQVAEMLTAGTYNVTVTDVNGCTTATSAIVINPPPVMGDYEDLAPLNCFGDETILNIVSISGGSGGPYKFSVDFGAVLDPNFPVTIGGGEHFITYIDVKDCAITETINVPEPLPITVTFDPNVIEVELGETANLDPIITGAAVIGSFVWTNPETLLDADTLNATAFTFENEKYTLTVVDSAGCSGSGSVMVNIDPNRNVYVPNAFIPANASGLNDHFNVYIGLGVEVVNFMHVYDRWGELLYQRENFIPNGDNLSEGWDGRYNGDFVNPGVYVYLVEVKFLDGRVLLYRGDVTVLR